MGLFRTLCDWFYKPIDWLSPSREYDELPDTDLSDRYDIQDVYFAVERDEATWRAERLGDSWNGSDFLLVHTPSGREYRVRENGDIVEVRGDGFREVSE